MNAGQGLDPGIAATKPAPHLETVTTKRKSATVGETVVVAEAESGAVDGGVAPGPGTGADPDDAARLRSAQIMVDTLPENETPGVEEEKDGEAEVADEDFAIPTGGITMKTLRISQLETLFLPIMGTSTTRHLIEGEMRTLIG